MPCRNNRVSVEAVLLVVAPAQLVKGPLPPHVEHLLDGEDGARIATGSRPLALRESNLLRVGQHTRESPSGP
mgnify:CR=1 FL=1